MSSCQLVKSSRPSEEDFMGVTFSKSHQELMTRKDNVDASKCHNILSKRESPNNCVQEVDPDTHVQMGS